MSKLGDALGAGEPGLAHRSCGLLPSELGDVAEGRQCRRRAFPRNAGRAHFDGCRAVVLADQSHLGRFTVYDRLAEVRADQLGTGTRQECLGRGVREANGASHVHDEDSVGNVRHDGLELRCDLVR